MRVHPYTAHTPPADCYCVHGRATYVVCPECQLLRRQNEREDRLSEVLDRFAGAVDALANNLNEGAGT